MSLEGNTWIGRREGGREGGSYLEASMEFHREKHLVPFLWAGSNVRRQNAAQWVNLQLSSSPPSPCPNFCLHAQIHNYFRTSRPGSLLMLSSGRGGDSFSHTPCIMFASFRAARAATCSAPGRIFNYFSRPWHLAVGAALAFATGASPTASFNGANSSLWRSFSSPFREGVKSTAPFASFRGNYGVKRAARGFCEHKSTQQLSVHHWSRPRVTACLYLLNVQPQTAAPPLEGPRSHDLSPFYSTVYLWSCRGSKSLECVGSERNCDATSLHKDPLRSSWNPAAADFPEEMKLPLSRGYSFLEKSPW